MIDTSPWSPLRGRAASLSIAVVVVLASLSGCARATPSHPSAPVERPLSLVILGDSLSVDPPHDCAGCTSYVEQYAAALARSTGPQTVVHDDAMDNSQLSDVTARITRSEVIEDLASADVVVVWIGANEGPPWNPDTPCQAAPAQTAEQQVVAVEGYTPECIAATMSLYLDRYSTLFARITELSPRASSRFALDTLNNWDENPAWADVGISAVRMEPVLTSVHGIFDDWNATQCAAAVASGFRCVDVYHALNGVDGRTPLGDHVADDYTHLSQRGHDEVAALLASASDG